MLKELFETISAQAVAASKLQLLDVPIPGKRLLVQRDGGLQEIDVPPEPRNHRANDLETVVAFAARQVGAAVWYNRQAVVCLCDDATRRDRVTLSLTLTPQLQQLQSLEHHRTAFKQPSFLLLMRTTFRDCLSSQSLIENLRQVRYKVGSDTQAVVGHGKSSVGRQLQAEASAVDLIPEYVTLDVPVFVQFPGLTRPVECALEPDAATETFQLLPLPGKIETAIRAAEHWIGEQLSIGLDDDAQVYFGQP